MKTIIAGSRDTQMATSNVFHVLKRCPWEVTEIVSGNGGNVDHAAEYCSSVLKLPCTVFKADWKLGRKAGPLRNAQMAEYADALIAIWDGKSRGTQNMINEAKKRNLKILVVEPTYVVHH